MLESRALFERLQRRIQLPPLRIACLIRSLLRRIRRNALRHLDRLAAGGIEVRPVPRPDACHQRAAEGAAFFRREDFDGLAIDASLNLAPERPARSAAAEAHSADGDAELREERECVLQRISDS